MGGGVLGLNSGWKGGAGENLCSLTRAGLPVEVLRRREPHRMKDNLWDDNGGALQLYSGMRVVEQRYPQMPH